MSTLTAMLVALSVALVGAASAAPAASAQDCAGRVSTSLTSATLPGGQWSVTDGCLTSDLFFEYHDGDVQAQAALSTVTYDDGHVGRVAVGMLTLGTGVGLSVVGVEDSATGLIKWSAVLGDYSQADGTASVSGAGVTLFPTEAAQLAVSIAGTGTDVTSLVQAGLDASTTTTVPTDPDASTTTTVVQEPLPVPSAPTSTTTTVPETAPSTVAPTETTIAPESSTTIPGG